MNEFSLINTYFKSISHHRDDVIFGIGDDAACVSVPVGKQLLVSCDTLVANIHFLPTWDAYDIACKAVMVNVSDMAAMAASPSWVLLALTLPNLKKDWLKRFSQGLQDSLNRFNIALIGGDTTHGPLSMTITIHGFVPEGRAVRRSGAKPGDKIYVSGELGAAACAVAVKPTDPEDGLVMMKKLKHPQPRLDLNSYLQAYATAAIDISDGLGADLNHICTASHVGACLELENVPVHPLVKKYQGRNYLAFALSGGDDYELCFTVSAKHEKDFLNRLLKDGLSCYSIGVIEERPGLRARTEKGTVVSLSTSGYNHF